MPRMGAINEVFAGSRVGIMQSGEISGGHHARMATQAWPMAPLRNFWEKNRRAVIS